MCGGDAAFGQITLTTCYYSIAQSHGCFHRALAGAETASSVSAVVPRLLLRAPFRDVLPSRSLIVVLKKLNPTMKLLK